MNEWGGSLQGYDIRVFSVADDRWRWEVIYGNLQHGQCYADEMDSREDALVMAGHVIACCIEGYQMDGYLSDCQEV